MGFKVKNIELKTGMYILYVEQGSPDGIPVILLPGYTDSWHVFEPMLPYLPKSLHAFSLTQRGYGDATKPEKGYTIENYAEDVIVFMNKLDLKSAVLIGGSSGGIVARHIAIEHPDRVLGIIFLGSPSTLRKNKRVRQVWEDTISQLTDPIDPVFVRDFIESTIYQPVPKVFVDKMVQDSLKVPARVWQAAFQGLMNDKSYNKIDLIKVPVLIIWGDGDTVLPKEDQELLKETIPDAKLVIYPNAGHMFYIEQPDRVASNIIKFIESL